MGFLTRFSLKNASAIVVLCILIVIGGIFSAFQIKQESMPDMSFPIVSVITAYPGAAPGDVINNITKPYENQILNINGIENVTSTSSENISAIIIQFAFSTNMDEAQRKVEEALKNVKLPDGAMGTKISRFNFNSMPIVNFSVSNKNLSPYDLEEKVRTDLLPGLSGINGVAAVQLSTESKKSVNIKLIPSKLKEYNLTSQQVMQLLQANNIEFPAGSVKMNDTIEPVRIIGKVNSFEDLKNLEISVMPKTSSSFGGNPATVQTGSLPGSIAGGPQTIYLSDLAEISLDTSSATSFSRTSGDPSIIVDIMKTQDSNTLNVSNAVKTKLAELKVNLPEDTTTSIIEDQAVTIKESINGMLHEGLLGALFAFLVILLFLRNFRTTIISIVSIPLSVLITLVFLKQFNISLNILTLGALSVATGRIVDDAIVVIENIYRHLHTDEESSIDIIKVATKEVTNAITSSTLTTVAVFLPMGLVSGFAGVMFRPFAITVSVALLSSLLVAVTVIPVMSKVLLVKSKTRHKDFHEGRIMKKYGSLLTWSLNHKVVVLLIAFVLFIGSLTLVPFIGTSFIPETKAKKLDINIDYPAGTAVEIINGKAAEIEKILSKDTSVLSYQTTVTSANVSNPMSALMAQSPGSISVKLKDNTNVDAEIKQLKNEIISTVDKAVIDIKQAQDQQGGGGSSNNIEVMVTGDNIDKIKQAAILLTKELASVQGLENISNNLSLSKPEIAIKVDQKKASKYGLSAAQAGVTIRELLNDSTVTSINVDNKMTEVHLGIKTDPYNKMDDIRSIELQSPMGISVKLSDIAEVSEVPGPVGIYTSDGREYAKVTANIIEKNTGAVSTRVEDKIKTVQLPDGVKTELGGVTQMMGDTFNQLGMAMMIAVFAVFLVMMIALRGLTAPLAILFSLPLAAIGGLVGLFITGITIDAPAMIGALMLIGIVVTNAIVLIDRVQQKRREGMPVREAILDAGKIRMRPILMTAMATIAALLPLGLGVSAGTMISQSLAVIVIGGLTTSTLLTLIVVPVAYEVFEKMKMKMFGEAETVESTI